MVSATQFHPHGAILDPKNSSRKINSNKNDSNSNGSKLQAVHYANLLAYIANITVTYIIGISGLFGLPTNGELSAKYQTLVTPAGYAFSIWGLVFLSQFIWVILQLLPKFRQVALQGVGWWYIITCLAQCAWSVFFSQEWIVLSMIAMASILVSLVMILILQARNSSVVDATTERQRTTTSSQSTTAAELCSFWGFQFPFQIHCGWIWAASVVNANVVVVAEGFSASYQFLSASTSLAGLGLVGG